MARRLRLQNRKDRRRFQRPVREYTDKPNSNGFSLKFAGGRGILELSGESIFDGITVELLEMVIDNIAFPFDVSRGVSGLASRRLKLHRISIEVALDAVSGYLSQRIAHNPWMHGLELAFYDDHISVSLMYGPVETAVPFSFRLIPVSWQNAFALMIDDVRCYGAMPAPLFSISAICATELTGFEMEGSFVIPKNPVKLALLHLLPAKGWRLPSYDDVQVEEFSLQSRRCSISFKAESGSDSSGDILRTLLSMPTLKRFEELRASRDVDTLIARGMMDEARRQLSGQFNRTPDNPSVVTRLAMLNILEPTLRRAELKRLLEKLSVWQNRSDALSIVAHGAALDGDVEMEMTALAQLFESGTPAEKVLTALRIAEVVGNTEPSRAIGFLEQAASVRRDNPEVLLALMELYGVERDIARLKTVISRWTVIHSEQVEQSAAHLEAGRVLLSVSEWYAAAAHFENVLVADPQNEDAQWGLAAALAGKGDAPRAITAYEQLAEKSRKKGADHTWAEALAHIGALWLEQEEPELAVSRLQESIGVNPDSVVQMKLAEALITLGRFEQAVMHYEEALETAPRKDDAFGKGALTLARLFFQELEDFDAARHWIEQAKRIESVRAEALELNIQVLEKQKKWRELAVALERNLLKEGPNASLDTVARLARARIAAGELTSAISTIESALAQHPHHAILLDVYIDALRRHKDHDRLADALQRRVETISSDETRVRLLTELGQVQHGTGKVADSLSAFREAVTLAPGNMTARAGLVEAMRATHDERLPDELNRLIAMYDEEGEVTKVAETQFALAEELFRVGESRKAISLVKEALPRLGGGKRKGATLLVMAQSLLAEKEYAIAREILEGIEPDGDAVDGFSVSLSLATASYHQGDFEMAYRSAVAAGSGPVALRGKALRILVDAAIHIGKLRDALGVLKRVAENIGEDEAMALLEYGADLAWRELEDIRLARDFYESIFALSPDNDRARNRLIALLENSGHRAELARSLVRFFSGKLSGIGEVKRAADFFLADGLFDEAVSALRDAYRLAPEVETARMLANALARAGRDTESRQLLMDIAGEDSHARDQLLTHYESRGELDEMVALLTASQSGDRRDEEKRLEKLARVLQLKGDDLQAAGYYLEAAELSESDDTVREMYARVIEIAVNRVHPQMYARALDGMKGFTSEEQMAEMKLTLSVMYFRNDMAEEASLLLEPEDCLRALSLEQLLKAVEENREMGPLVHRVLEYAVEQEKWAEADQLLTILLFFEKDDGRYGLLKRRAELRSQHLGDRDGAASDWMEIGEYYQKELENEAEAMACFRRSLTLNGANMQALMQLGERAYSIRDWEELGALLQLAAGVSWHPRVALWKALIAEMAGRTEEAFALYEELQDRAPQMDEANEGYLRTVPEEGYEGNVRQALAVVRRQGGLGQMSAAVHRKAARAYLAGTEMDNARRHLEIALSLEPLDRNSLLLLAHVYEAGGQSSARAYTLEKVAELVTGDERIDYFVASGRIFLDELNDPVRAMNLFTRAAAISRNEPDVLLGLADCSWAIGEWGGVTSSLERLRLVAPHLAIDAVRMYRFAAALFRTGEWPVADVLELLERTIPVLTGSERQDAEALDEKLKLELASRKGRK